MPHSAQAKAIDDLSLSGPLTVKVNGECMDDSVPNGCSMKLNRRPLYWPGDVVVFRRGDQQLVSHRMLGYLPGRRGWKVVTKADREPRPDAPHHVSRILGKSVAIDNQAFTPGPLKRLQSAAAFIPALFYLVSQRFTARL